VSTSSISSRARSVAPPTSPSSARLDSEFASDVSIPSSRRITSASSWSAFPVSKSPFFVAYDREVARAEPDPAAVTEASRDVDALLEQRAGLLVIALDDRDRPEVVRHAAALPSPVSTPAPPF